MISEVFTGLRKALVKAAWTAVGWPRELPLHFHREARVGIGRHPECGAC